MKIQKKITGTLKPKQIPALKHRVCPSCHKKGHYKTDKQLNTYCTECGLIIETPYPFDAGLRHWTYCDFIFNQKIRELKKWKNKKKKSL